MSHNEHTLCLGDLHEKKSTAHDVILIWKINNEFVTLMDCVTTIRRVLMNASRAAIFRNIKCRFEAVNIVIQLQSRSYTVGLIFLFERYFDIAVMHFNVCQSRGKMVC